VSGRVNLAGSSAAVGRSPGGPAGLAALFLCGTALRPQLVGISPLLPSLEHDLGISHAVAGLLTALPLVCMGGFAFLGVPIARLIGSRMTVTMSLFLLAGAGLIRGLVAVPVATLLSTIGVGVGIAVAGTVLPQVVKESYGEHPVRATGSYAAGIQVGSTLSAAVAIPIAVALGGWHASLVVFSVFSAAVLMTWLAFAPRPAARTATVRHAGGWLRSALWLAVTFALFAASYYGLITWLPEIYIRLGWTPVASGFLLGVLNAGAIAGGLAIALLAGRRRASYRLAFLLTAAFAVSVTGFIVAPGLAVVWAILAGATNGALLPLVLAFPLEFSTDPSTVAWATAIMLGAGYMLAAIAPVVLGSTRDISGTFAASELLLAGMAWAFVAAVIVTARTRAHAL
jgi:MFS transporter, CP family, cyanate transporter